jgi:hypothetical protein
MCGARVAIPERKKLQFLPTALQLKMLLSLFTDLLQ